MRMPLPMLLLLLLLLLRMLLLRMLLRRRRRLRLRLLLDGACLDPAPEWRQHTVIKKGHTAQGQPDLVEYVLKVLVGGSIAAR